MTDTNLLPKRRTPDEVKFCMNLPWAEHFFIQSQMMNEKCVQIIHSLFMNRFKHGKNLQAL